MDEFAFVALCLRVRFHKKAPRHEANWQLQFDALLEFAMQSGAMVGGLWEGPIRTLANQRGPPSNSERDPDEPRELQLVLDPEFL